MRAYRESFVDETGRRGLTQEELLRRMAVVDKDYAERYSHSTVSRWESGGTRPTVKRLQVFGTALNLPHADIAGLLLLAGLAPDFQTALVRAASDDSDKIAESVQTQDGAAADIGSERSGTPVNAGPSSIWKSLVRFWVFRFLALGVCIAGVGYGLTLFGWNDEWMPEVYVGVVSGLVLAQGFLLPDREAGMREFFWVSVFFLLSTPLIQFAPIRMDHYGLCVIPGFFGTHMPYMLALMVNLCLASIAALMYQTLWKWHYGVVSDKGSAVQRAIWVVLPPVCFVYGVVVVISNASVWIQLAVLMPVLAVMFITLLVLRDPTINPSERDRRLLFPATLAVAIVSTTLGIVTVLTIYASPDLPMVLPDHNLIRSWEIDLGHGGYSREEALERLNIGYLWHATCLIAYMVFVLGGNVMVAIYRMGGPSHRDTDWEYSAEPDSDPEVRSWQDQRERPSLLSNLRRVARTGM